MNVTPTQVFHLIRSCYKAFCLFCLYAFVVGCTTAHGQLSNLFPDTLILRPIADAFVQNGAFAANNFGFDTALHVKGTTAAGAARNIYIKFPLNKMNNVLSARLRLYGRNIDNTKAVLLSVFGVENDTWTESGLTWNNVPVAQPVSVGGFSITNQGRYHEIDITEFAKQQLAKDKVLSLFITDTANQDSHLSLNSREQLLYKPELVITTTAIVPPSNTHLFVENLDGFPSNEDFIASRIQVPWSRDKVVFNTNHDTVRVRLHNKGLRPSVISNMLLSNRSGWKIATLKDAVYDSATVFPLIIEAGSFADMQIQFIAVDPTPIRVKLLLDELTIVSNDDNHPFKTIYLRGLWQREGEGSKEPTAQEMLKAFGFRTRTGFDAIDPDRGASNKPKGDEVLTSYFVRVDTTQPVSIRQMGAYHGCCTVQPDSISWYLKEKRASLINATRHLAEDAQRLLPRSSRNALYTPAKGSFTPSGAFGFKVGNFDWSDTLLTPQRKIGLRVWKAIDARGLVIPNAYIIANDYLGTSFTNFDYNDNMYFVSNVRPELGPASVSELASTPSAVDFGEQLLQSHTTFSLNLRSLGQRYLSGAQDPSITIAAIVITGENKEEFIASLPEKTDLQVEETTTLALHFQPHSEGLKMADLLIYYNTASPPLRVPLYGIGKTTNTTVAVPYRIKSGASSEVVIHGKTWVPDVPFAFDNLQPNAMTQLVKIRATEEDALYFTEQSSDGDKRPFRYEMPVPNGSYWVRLHFAETYWGTPAASSGGGAGSRVMSVELEGGLKLINLDVMQEVGAASAVIKNIPVTVNDGKLNINFSASSNRPMICAVEVYQFKTATVTSTRDLPQTRNVEKVNVFPNPLHQQFTISYPAGYNGTIQLQLTDMMGRIYNLYKTQARTGGATMAIDVSPLGLAPGVYFLRLFSANNKTEAVKLIVQ